MRDLASRTLHKVSLFSGFDDEMNNYLIMPNVNLNKVVFKW